MSDRTPIEQLSGPILCERTAEAMGWKRKARMDNEYGKWWTDKNGKDRRIRSVNAPYECSFDFRPDLDGNHLSEVMAEAEHRGWCHGWGYAANSGHRWAHCKTGHGTFELSGQSQFVAFLRAFVAAWLRMNPTGRSPMDNKKPVDQLEGVELCGRTLEAMGYERVESKTPVCWTYYNENRSTVEENPYRFVPFGISDMGGPNFRPDLNWNHLAEVAAEVGRRDYEVEYHRFPGGEHRVTMGRGYRFEHVGETVNEALLRAFVAASESDKGNHNG